MNAFMQYVADGQANEFRPNATTQTYVLGHYSEEIGRMVMEEFREWREVMEKCLIKIYGEEAGKNEAEAMMILISGTFICNYNHVPTSWPHIHIHNQEVTCYTVHNSDIP